MIIDSHLHLWVKNKERYPWSAIGGYIPEAEAPLQHFLKVAKENRVNGAVFVQPTPYGWDNSYLLDCKNSDPKKFKAVVLVDPDSENASETLSGLKDKGADGLRINLHLQTIEHWQKESFNRLWQTCELLALPICLQLTPKYFDLVRRLSETYETKIVLDHLGRPQPGTTPVEQEFRQLLNLAEIPHIYVKLSGLYYYSNENAPFQDTWDLLKATKQKFGADHCVWGSDFPFVEKHWSYRESLKLIQEDLGFSETDLQCILEKTPKKLWWREV